MVVFLVHCATDVEAARALAWRLRWHDCTPTAVWISPADDAAMTARVLVEILEWSGPIEVQGDLRAARTDPAPVATALAAVAHDASVVVVGHEPLLSALGRTLAGGEALPPLAAAEAIRYDDGEPRWRFAHDGAAPVAGHGWPR